MKKEKTKASEVTEKTKLEADIIKNMLFKRGVEIKFNCILNAEDRYCIGCTFTDSENNIVEITKTTTLKHNTNKNKTIENTQLLTLNETYEKYMGILANRINRDLEKVCDYEKLYNKVKELKNNTNSYTNPYDLTIILSTSKIDEISYSIYTKAGEMLAKDNIKYEEKDKEGVIHYLVTKYQEIALEHYHKNHIKETENTLDEIINKLESNCVEKVLSKNNYKEYR